MELIKILTKVILWII